MLDSRTAANALDAVLFAATFKFRWLLRAIARIGPADLVLAFNESALWIGSPLRAAQRPTSGARELSIDETKRPLLPRKPQAVLLR